MVIFRKKYLLFEKYFKYIIGIFMRRRCDIIFERDIGKDPPLRKGVYI